MVIVCSDSRAMLGAPLADRDDQVTLVVRVVDDFDRGSSIQVPPRPVEPGDDPLRCPGSPKKRDKPGHHLQSPGRLSALSCPSLKVTWSAVHEPGELRPLDAG